MNSSNTEIQDFAPRIPDNEYLALLTILNQKQSEFYLHVMQTITSMEEPLRVFLTGGAGVGKSVVVKVLYQSLYRYLNSTEGTDPEDCKIIMCAPTGKAAFNINGQTIHSAFQINPNRGFNYMKLNSDKLNSLQVKYRHLQVVIIDEISMVGNREILFISERLKEIKQNQQTFGGIHIIVVKDLYQLKPVMDNWIFENLAEGYGALATNIWRDELSVRSLTQIMRQKDDKEFAEILNRLREGNQAQEDIKELQKCLTNETDVENTMIHLYPTNALANNYNTQIFEQSEKQKTVIQAIDTIPGDYSASVKQYLKEQFPKEANKTAGLLCSLPIAVDSICETVANIDVQDGITNGSACIIKHIQYLQHNNTKPSIIWVQFDKERVGHITRTKYKQYFISPIQPTWTPIFAISRNFFLTKKIMVTRQQFPLKPATAKTIHKAQGDTVDEIAVHMGSYKIEHAHYVALSRVRTKKGLHIIHLNETKIKTSETFKIEMQRLKHESSLQLCYDPFYNITGPYLKITLQNARSLHKHIKNVSSDLNIMSSDIIAIVETRLKETDNPQAYELPEFGSVTNNQSCESQIRPHHGQIIYVRQTLTYVMKDVYQTNTIEAITITLRNTLPIQMCLVYKSPSCLNDFFFDFVSNHLTYVIDVKQPLVILGDFNFTRSRSEFINLMIRTFRCSQHIDKPTRGQSLLDMVFSNLNVYYSNVIYCSWSDHSTIQCVFQV
ncbi:ATP-dependent DNA helicase pfh1 [Holothuria leucospilota]|uniref:ATP-dependent DNA helicase n=1 Tax=Holothuria leucospilota TaxID=206669 RepID=A0A9Q1CQI5_HOLLE|nr:ATP-dependent DNA helicase pfh1 [Holothuria leucospilota]